MNRSTINLKFMIESGEGYNLEFKKAFSAGLGKEICAFANANGGKILLGVDDGGRIVGIDASNRLSSQVQSIARNIDPSLDITLDRIGKVFVIDVPEGSEKPYSTNGKFFLRYGSNSQQLKRDEIREFFQTEGLVLFDERPNYDFDMKEDFVFAKFDLFLEKAGITPAIERNDILGNLRLLEDGHMKNAGVLFFCDRVTKFFFQCTITCLLYLGKTKYKILDRKEFDGDLHTIYKNAIIYLQTHLNTEYIIRGGPREEKLELPEEALREALLNAIAHRDYFVTGANILVDVYSDRVEITNPGGLVKGITPDDLGKKSLSRNNLLFGLMQRMDLSEKAGSGIPRMRTAMKEHNLEGPEFEINEDWFTIIFRRPKISTIPKPGTRKREKMLKGDQIRENILRLTRENPGISKEELASILDVSSDGIRYHLRLLRKMNKLRWIGTPRKGYWKAQEK